MINAQEKHSKVGKGLELEKMARLACTEKDSEEDGKCAKGLSRLRGLRTLSVRLAWLMSRNGKRMCGYSRE